MVKNEPNALRTAKVSVGGQGSKTADKIGKGIFEEVNLGKYWQDVLGRYSPNSYRG